MSPHLLQVSVFRPIQWSRSNMETHRRTIVVVVVVMGVLFGASTRASAEDIRGTIVRTLILSEDSRLVGDVTCQVTGGPCIAFGAPNISLSLNGFSITGPNDAATGCGGTNVGTDT